MTFKTIKLLTLMDFSVTPKSASFHKPENIKSPVKEKKLSGYRIIDIKILSNVFSILLRQISQCETLVLHEDSSQKHGLCSSLYLKCMKCEYKNDCSTSAKVGRSFEINQRIVYSVRSLGQSYTGIGKFNALMNIPPPMTKNT